MSWSGELVELIIAGQAGDFPINRIDDLIAWTVDRDTPATRLISKAFTKRTVARDDGVQLSLAVLDKLFFTLAGTPWEALGLAPGANEKHTRVRYRRLLSIFHPDRQLGSAEWCHERTDRLNQAFRQIQEGQGDVVLVGLAPGGPVAGKTRKRPQRKPRLDLMPAGIGIGDDLREWMGGSRSFQKKFFSLLILGASVILLLLYYAGVEPEVIRAALMPSAQLEDVEPARTGFIQTLDRSETVQEVLQAQQSAEIEPQPATIEIPPKQAPAIATTSPKPLVEAARPVQLSATAQAILVDQAPPPEPARIDVCASSDSFLADFSRYYQSGDLFRYLKLYAEDAVENDAQGIAAIFKIYSAFFGTTSHRVINLEITSRDSPSNDVCILGVAFSARYLDQSGQQLAVTSQILFLLAPAEGGGVLISQMQY